MSSTQIKWISDSLDSDRTFYIHGYQSSVTPVTLVINFSPNPHDPPEDLYKHVFLYRVVKVTALAVGLQR